MGRKFGELPLDAEPIAARPETPRKRKPRAKEVTVPHAVLVRIRALRAHASLPKQADLLKRLNADPALARELGRFVSRAEVVEALHIVDQEPKPPRTKPASSSAARPSTPPLARSRLLAGRHVQREFTRALVYRCHACDRDMSSAVVIARPQSGGDLLCQACFSKGARLA
jgi:hypothetical protein